jgi:hypothetical protein
MRCCPPILFLAILITSLGFNAEKPVQSAPATVRCPLPPDEDWTSQEKFVWERVCVGEPADFNNEAAYGGKRDPRELGTLPEGRILSQAFLETILLDERHRSVIARPGVRIFGARFPELIDLQNATLQNELWLEGCLLERGANLSWLKSTQPIGIHGSRVGAALTMYSLQVDSNVFLDESEFAADVKLIGAKIGHTLDMSRSKVSDKLDLDSLRVEVHLFMRDAEFDEIVLENAQIGGQLDFSGSTFHKNVTLNGAHIGGALQFVSAQWSDDGILSLRNARADVIPSLSDPWPNKLDLDGLTYRNLDTSRSSGIVRNDFNRWFDKLLQYSRQPYEQLATVLQTQGDIGSATDVRYSARERERRDATGWVWLWLTLLDLVVGYGYYPQYTFVWAAVFVIIGAVVLRIFGEGPKNGIGIAYSFDMLLPLVRLREKHYTIDLAGPARYYFYFHRIMGWVLASFFVAGLSGLTQ